MYGATIGQVARFEAGVGAEADVRERVGEGDLEPEVVAECRRRPTSNEPPPVT